MGGLDIRDYNMGMDNVDLLVKGLRSSPIAKGRIRLLYLSLWSLSFSQVITPLKKFCKLNFLTIIHNNDYVHDDEVILRELIAPGSGLKRLEYSGVLRINTLVTQLFL